MQKYIFLLLNSEGKIKKTKHKFLKNNHRIQLFPAIVPGIIGC